MDNQEKRIIEIAYLKGLQNKQCRKTFKSESAAERWVEKNSDDIEIVAYRIQI